MNQKLIIIRGPPGIGKSTLSKQLAKRLKGGVTVIDIDVIRWGFIVKRTKSYNDHNLVYKNLWDLTKNSLDDGQNVIIEGVLAGRDKNERLRISKYDSYKKEGIQVVYFFLKGSSKSQNKRLKHRNKKKPSERDIINWTKLSYSSISKNDVVIDTDNKTLNQIVELMVRRIRN